MIVKCPWCGRGLLAKFTPRNTSPGGKYYKGAGTMARFYAYCKRCKCSITKTLRKDESAYYTRQYHEAKRKAASQN